MAALGLTAAFLQANILDFADNANGKDGPLEVALVNLSVHRLDGGADGIFSFIL